METAYMINYYDKQLMCEDLILFSFYRIVLIWIALLRKQIVFFIHFFRNKLDNSYNYDI